MENSIVTDAPSSSVGDYLKAVWEVAGLSGEAAGTSEIATRLSVSAASVSNMFGRLQEMGLVDYERYRGAVLTGRGRSEALRLVRRHRLIETFLLEHLGYSWREVHGEAEKLEHAVSDRFTTRLAEFLGHPDHDPHGDPIPTAEGILEPDDSRPLNQSEPGQRVRIFKVSDEDSTVLDYFGERGLTPGRTILVREVRAIDRVVTVEDEKGGSHSFGEPLARCVFVQPEF